jgi:4'-phosphopantetheinyl transferase EntD
VLELVASPAERERLATTQREPDPPNWDRLLFSAKEAVYKAWFPLAGEWLDHQEAEIIFDPHHQTFTARRSSGARHPSSWRGRPSTVRDSPQPSPRSFLNYAVTTLPN